MELTELETIITNSGGSSFALAGAPELLTKINRLEEEEDFSKLFTQFKSSKDPGDLRGRILEINFAYLFLEKNEQLQYEQMQGMPGDIDFLWKFENFNIYIEIKLLRQDIATQDGINNQLETNETFEVFKNDSSDIFRIQRDIFLKSSTKKFNPNLEKNIINFVAIDTSELQLGMVDPPDCLLATGGNNLIFSIYHNPSLLRRGIVGVFESIPKTLTTEQKNWLINFHEMINSAPHPRNYIHGVLFLFRMPKNTAALTYNLSSVIYINNSLIDLPDSDKILKALTSICPKYEEN